MSQWRRVKYLQGDTLTMSVDVWTQVTINLTFLTCVTFTVNWVVYHINYSYLTQCKKKVEEEKKVSIHYLYCDGMPFTSYAVLLPITRPSSFLTHIPRTLPHPLAHRLDPTSPFFDYDGTYTALKKFCFDYYIKRELFTRHAKWIVNLPPSPPPTPTWNLH